MRGAALITSLALLAIPTIAPAQHGGGRGAAPPRTAPREAAQFDFLIGQWELTVRPKVTSLAARIHGAPRLLGTWKAWRAFDGWGIEDELRIVDGSGNPMALTHTMRAWDAAARGWRQSAFDVYGGRFVAASAEWDGREMVVRSTGTGPDGASYVSRTRFYDIAPGSFKFRQDRSSDDGRTWDEAVLTMEAKRVAASAPR